MSLSSNPGPRPKAVSDWSRLMRELGPRFAERAGVHDANDSFVAENFAELRARGVFAAGVPAELGGGGASYADLAGMLAGTLGGCVLVSCFRPGRAFVAGMIPGFAVLLGGLLLDGWFTTYNDKAPLASFLLVLLAPPFLHVSFTGGDASALPASSSAAF